METVANFFHMGGYAAFVWPAFGLVAAVLVGLLVASRRALKADERTLMALQQASGRRDTGEAARNDAPAAEIANET